MENHIKPITVTKRIWKLLMARKLGITSKCKLLLNINLLLKRSSKALIRNLIFHHHRHPPHYYSSPPSYTLSTKDEYEFSCSDTPASHAMFNFIHHHLPGGNKATTNKKHHDVHLAAEDIDCPELFLDEESYEAVSRVLDTLAMKDDNQLEGSVATGSLSSSSNLNLNYPMSHYSSPVDYNLPRIGFGNSPRVRQLRVSADSPFPLAKMYNNEDDDQQVDEAAEEFISRFYSQLRQQRLTPGPYGADQ